MLTLAEHRTRIRTALAEPTARTWQNAELDEWINLAAKDVARRTESLEDFHDQATTAGDGEYFAQDDTLRIHRIEWRTATFRAPLEYRDYHSMDVAWWGSQERQGDPMFYTMWGFPPDSLNIKVFPTPNAVGTLRLFFYRLPAPATDDTDVIEIVEGWEDLITYYVEFSALRADRDSRWAEAHSLYESLLSQMQTLSPRWTDVPDAIQWKRVNVEAPVPTQTPPPGSPGIQYPQVANGQGRQ